MPVWEALGTARTLAGFSWRSPVELLVIHLLSGVQRGDLCLLCHKYFSELPAASRTSFGGKTESVKCKIHFDLSLCSYRVLVSVQGGYHQTILATKRLHEEHLGFLLAHTGGPTGIRFQLSKRVHPRCIYRLVLVDEPLTSQVLCICTRWVIHLKNPSFLNLPEAHWIILTIKLLLRENGFKAQR